MCKECGQVFDTIESLKEHEKSEEEDKELQNKRLWCGFVAFDRNHTLVPQDQKERLIQKIAIPTLSTLEKYASDYRSITQSQRRLRKELVELNTLFWFVDEDAWPRETSVRMAAK